MDLLDLDMLQKLSEADGIAGCEAQVSQLVRSYFENYTESIDYDDLGSIIGLQRGHESDFRIMLAGHMDEVGFLVREIDGQGYVKLIPVGSWWGHVMPCQIMRITTDQGQKIEGIIGSRAPHGMDQLEKEKVIPPLEHFLDLGVASKEEVMALGVQIGDMVTPATAFAPMNSPQYLRGKAWDDRIGVAVVVEVLKRLQHRPHAASIYGVGTVQEEVGLRGARTAGYKVKPHIALAIDVTTAQDTPLEKGELGLGRGAVLSLLDATALGNQKLIDQFRAIAEELQIAFHYDCMTVGGTDTGNLHKIQEGVLAMSLSIPVRYMHSPQLVIHQQDVLDTIELITTFCEKMDKKTYLEWIGGF